jgi:ABC-type Zn uptake system ZnuABC Zn-binding protein ZnuA/ABC-type Mn2+/Zn2+ transport system permease subunit
VFEPFSLPFVQRGVVEVLLLAVGAGLLGTWIVLRGLAFYAHAVGTAAFPGLVLADGLGFSASLGAFGTAAIVAALVGLLSRRERETYDAATALVLVGALALGVILASDVFASQAGVEQLLFGSLLLVDGADQRLAAAASAAVLAASLVLGPRWLATGFDAPTARAQGLRSPLPDALLLALVALLAVATLTILGALLATALLVVPAATTRLVVDRLRPWQLATVALVVAEGVAGLWLSVKLNAPPGATIASLAGAVFALVALGRALGPRGRVAAALAGAAALATLAVAVAGCGSDDGSSTAGGGHEPIKVVASTTQLGDVARAVGGDAVKVTQILRPNTDPHDYEPRPADIEATADADVVLTSGDNLDRWMGEVVKTAGGSPRVLDAGAGRPDTLAGQRGGAEGSRFDPHWWHDPRNMEFATERIRAALVAAGPRARARIDRGAAAYLARLRALDAGIARCIDGVPAPQRKLVTDHDAFGYFARRYGIRIVGAVIPSLTTQAQPSAGELSALVGVIRRERVKAVFPESSVNAKLAKAIARQTGAAAGYTLYGDTLGPEGSPGATYLSSERANADAMVRGFTAGARGCAIPGL